MRQTSRALGLLAGLVVLCGSAQAEPFGPFKDELFAYPEPVASIDRGRRLDVPYSEVRDIDRRDEIPERRVKRVYVDLGGGGRSQEHEIATAGGPLRYATVGPLASGKPVVVFVHGRNGDRRLGVNDWSFGGNFNRLKNLLVRSGGTYVTVDGGRLDERDAARVATLLERLKRDTQPSTMVLACASMGGQICWTIGAGAAVRSVDAIVLLGSDSSIEHFEAMRKARGKPIPVLIAHGTRDKVYAFERQLETFEAIRKRRPAEPIRFVGFEDGNHGTPIRMIDWRDTLNWIAGEVSPGAGR